MQKQQIITQERVILSSCSIFNEQGIPRKCVDELVDGEFQQISQVEFPSHDHFLVVDSDEEVFVVACKRGRVRVFDHKIFCQPSRFLPELLEHRPVE